MPSSPRETRDPAEHELGIQPVPAFLEVTAVRHLRDHVRGADEMTDLAVERVVETDLVERHLVTREVHDLRGDRHPLAHAERRQVAREELRAAPDMCTRELGAVAVLRSSVWRM